MFGVIDVPAFFSKQDASGRSERLRLFTTPLPRGALTRMEGFAARTVKDISCEPTASIIFRQLHVELLAAKEDKA